MRFALINLGCKVNRVESDAFAMALLARGGVMGAEAHADLIVVNTCTVTGEAEKKTRKAVRRALRANVAATVVVTGCAVAIDAATYEAMDDRVRVVAKGALLHAIEGGEWDDAEHCAFPYDVAHLRRRWGFRTRIGIKVQDGCDNACTYCIVHVARGRAVSRPADAVLDEAMGHARAGVKEIVLTGINLGSYRDGTRSDPEALRLADLLHRLLEETAELSDPEKPPVRFRLSSVEPCDVDEALIDVLAHSQGRVCRHLHLPLQAGSSKVLREMARPYDAEAFAELVTRLYERVPNLALSTDVIAGFPGETDVDFQETLDLVGRCRFSKIHAFSYSPRTGTPAAARTDQIPPDVRTRRAAEVRALGSALRMQAYSCRVGTVERVLVEGGGRGTTESYFEIDVPKHSEEGSLVEMRLPPADAMEQGRASRPG